MKLPVGINYKDKLYPEVEISPPTGRLLKQLRNSLLQNAFDAKIYLLALKEGISSIEGWSGRPSEEMLRCVYWPDAEFIFMQMAKIDLEDEGPTITRQCPNCGKADKVTFSFDDIKVIYLDDPDCESKFANPERLIDFHLKDPITSLDIDKTPYDTGKMGLLTLSDWMRIVQKERDKVGSIQMASVAAVVYQLGPAGKLGEKPFAVSDIEGLRSRDIKMLERLYNENEPGPKMPDPIPCSHCGVEIPLYINWVRDFLASNPA